MTQQSITRTSLLEPLVLLLLVCFCSANENLVIVGGTEVIVGRYPYAVVLMEEGSVPFCGGTLIAPNYVLTAAHCSHNSYTVHIGRHDLASSLEDYEEIEVLGEIIHPDFNYDDLNYDLMLIELQVPSEYDPLTLDDGSMELLAGRDVTVIGWGAECEGGPHSDVLLETEVDIIDIVECRTNYPNGAITEQMLCAARQDRDACQGDSGGPLIVKRGTSDEDVLVGIISWGYGCADQDFPGVYSRVSQGYDWIMDSMGEGVEELDVLRFRVGDVLMHTLKRIRSTGRDLLEISLSTESLHN